jgi:membrane protease YdiL (CAAX protease family)
MSSNSGWGEPDRQSAPSSLPVVSAGSDGSQIPAENPPFSGLHVAQIGLLMFLVPVLVSPFLIVLAQKILYPQLSFADVAQKPWILLAPQFVWFAVVALFLIDYTKSRFHQTLWKAIRWNWPKQGWLPLVGIGIATLLVLQGLERLLPLPKNGPFDQFFKRPVDAYAFAFLAIAFAPFMEELFFRGFLYPVLARKLGVPLGVLLTALPFALIHAFEYKAWGPVLIVFLVGVVLTVVRAKKQSVAASFIVHSIYNGVPVIAAVIASRGFQHLDKLAH